MNKIKITTSVFALNSFIHLLFSNISGREYNEMSFEEALIEERLLQLWNKLSKCEQTMKTKQKSEGNISLTQLEIDLLVMQVAHPKEQCACDFWALIDRAKSQKVESAQRLGGNVLKIGN
jgi:hypothetical protein